jgi:DNA-binding beta-propeller fold protein YncE
MVRAMFTLRIATTTRSRSGRSISNSVTTVIGTGLNLPNSVVVDAAGNVFVVDTFNQIIKELPRAFVDQTPRTISNAAASSSLAARVAHDQQSPRAVRAHE